MDFIVHSVAPKPKILTLWLGQTVAPSNIFHVGGTTTENPWGEKLRAGVYPGKSEEETGEAHRQVINNCRGHDRMWEGKRRRRQNKRGDDKRQQTRPSVIQRKSSDGVLLE